MSQAERAISLDLDGVVIWRPPFQLGAFTSRHVKRRGAQIFNPPQEVPVLSREIKNDHLRVGEMVSFLMHSIRRVNGSVPDFLDTYSSVDIYGNTGRANRTPWVNMTMHTLQRAGVAEVFKDVYFKPPGTKTMLSKLAAIDELRRKYGVVTHLDDNPADALPIAAFFQDVQVVIVQDLTTGLLYSREEAEKYPNVKRVASLKKLV